MNTNRASADLVRRIASAPPPQPWEDAGSVPWSDPLFSRRMLREHLDQSHDRASRRISVIDAHVDWIHERILRSKPSRILDLGCGPGLYTLRLAELGHRCVGIDCAPAAIDYARNLCATASFHLMDIRDDQKEIIPGHSFDLTLMLYGNLSMFPPDEASSIVRRCRNATADSGVSIVEVMTEEAVRKLGTQNRYWRFDPISVFSDRPCLSLEEYFWFPSSRTASVRYWILEQDTESVSVFVQSFQAWTRDHLQLMFESAGFEIREIVTHIGGVMDDNEDDLETWVLAAR